MGLIKSLESNLLSLQIVASPEGQAMPSTSVAWSLTDELITQMKERDFKNPHLLLIIASHRDDYYTVTKSYSIPLGTTSPPKKYIQFSRPGDNIVVATIIDVRNPSLANGIRHITNGATVRLSDEGEVYWDGHLECMPHLDVQASQKVTLDSKLFAPPPPRWLRKTVGLFFRTSEFDQCHFRRRALVSIFLMIPVQLYGIFARILTLLYAVVLARRDMSLRSFFALNPHEFAHNLGSSFWSRDSEGNERPGKSIFWYINPISFAVYAIALGILLIPGWVYHLFNQPPEGTRFITELGQMALASLIIDPILALIIFLIWFSASYERRRNVKAWIAELKQPAPSTEAVYQSIQQHQTRQLTSSDDVLQVPDATIALRFNALKAKVCRPFAR